MPSKRCHLPLENNDYQTVIFSKEVINLLSSFGRFHLKDGILAFQQV